VTYLLDTQIVLWLSGEPEKLSATARRVIEDPQSELRFSPVSILEISIKRAKGRGDFLADPFELSFALPEHEILELPVSSLHAAHVSLLALIHKDPFDRLLLAQAVAEDIVLFTTDRLLIQYPSNVMDAR
jgi:PIN domain nuclease of toxin-antitoxin system